MKHKEKRKHLEKKLLQRPGEKSKCRKGKMDFQEFLQSRGEELAPIQDLQVADTSASALEEFACGDKCLNAKLQSFSVAAPEAHEVVPSSSLDAGENFSASAHFPCISSLSMRIPMDQNGLGSSEMLLSQESMKTENSCFMPHSHLPLTSASSPSASTASTEKKRIMNVYYKPVSGKRSVAALEDMEEDWEPPAKMMRIGKVICPERNPPTASFPDMCLAGILTEGKDSLDSEKPEEREEAEKPPKNLSQEAGPSAQTPAGLEDMYSGFRCMGCCQVFPSLRLLKKHLKHGAEEDVSCLNLAFAKLKNKGKTSKISRKENTNIPEAYGDDMEILLKVLLLLAFYSFLFYYYNK
ncbi:PREDICTED: protein FAM170A-like isoform X1 [Chinchilla lanigera]|uniref:protein FAM170A-like isoform X1 n=1 Tax=Chinchilla lanigera TaxID=34839 RepID=UPI00038EB3EC|nr:PREDICTED: protein FAM170A-like isoform X1 [Chinchilla lanigera]